MFFASDDDAAGRPSPRSSVPPGNAASIRIEVGGDLHEFGKLGRLVSAREAATLL